MKRERWEVEKKEGRGIEGEGRERVEATMFSLSEETLSPEFKPQNRLHQTVFRVFRLFSTMK